MDSKQFSMKISEQQLMMSPFLVENTQKQLQYAMQIH